MHVHLVFSHFGIRLLHTHTDGLKKNLFGNCQFGFYLICCVHRWLFGSHFLSLSHSRDTIILVKQTHTHNNAFHQYTLPVAAKSSNLIKRILRISVAPFYFHSIFWRTQREHSICYVAFKSIVQRAALRWILMPKCAINFRMCDIRIETVA